MRTIPCPSCGEDVAIRASSAEPGETTGVWAEFSCSCGEDGFICKRDYDKWQKVKRKKERRAA